MSSSTRMAIGRAIAAERVAAGLSQEEFGRRMGWSRSTVSAIETGVRPFYAEDIPEVCETLGCSAWDLLRRVSARDSRVMGLDG